jgi:hypothetical protein
MKKQQQQHKGFLVVEKQEEDTRSVGEAMSGVCAALVANREERTGTGERGKVGGAWPVRGELGLDLTPTLVATFLAWPGLTCPSLPLQSSLPSFLGLVASFYLLAGTRKGRKQGRKQGGATNEPVSECLQIGNFQQHASKQTNKQTHKR